MDRPLKISIEPREGGLHLQMTVIHPEGSSAVGETLYKRKGQEDSDMRRIIASKIRDFVLDEYPAMVAG